MPPSASASAISSPRDAPPAAAPSEGRGLRRPRAPRTRRPSGRQPAAGRSSTRSPSARKRVRTEVARRQGCVWRVSFRRSSGPAQHASLTDQPRVASASSKTARAAGGALGQLAAHADGLRALRAEEEREASSGASCRLELEHDLAVLDRLARSRPPGCAPSRGAARGRRGAHPASRPGPARRPSRPRARARGRRRTRRSRRPARRRRTTEAGARSAPGTDRDGDQSTPAAGGHGCRTRGARDAQPQRRRDATSISPRPCRERRSVSAGTRSRAARAISSRAWSDRSCAPLTLVVRRRHSARCRSTAAGAGRRAGGGCGRSAGATTADPVACCELPPVSR